MFCLTVKERKKWNIKCHLKYHRNNKIFKLGLFFVWTEYITSNILAVCFVSVFAIFCYYSIKNLLLINFLALYTVSNLHAFIMYEVSWVFLVKLIIINKMKLKVKYKMLFFIIFLLKIILHILKPLVFVKCLKCWS